MKNLVRQKYEDEILIWYTEIDYGNDKLRLVFKSSCVKDRYGQRALRTIAEIRHVNELEGKYKHTTLEDYRKILQTIPLDYQYEKSVTKLHNYAVEHNYKRVVESVNLMYNVNMN